MPKGQFTNKQNNPKFIEYYQEHYPNLSHEEHLKLKKDFCKTQCKQSIEYYKKYCPELTNEEQEALRQEYIRKRKSNSPNNIEYYEKRYPEFSHEEHLNMLHEFAIRGNYLRIEYYEQRYPELSHEEHLEMIRKRSEETRAKLPDNSGVNNPSHRSKTTEQQRKERSVMCIEYWRKKYPDLDEKDLEMLLQNKKKELADRARETPSSTQLRYWLAKGYNEEEAKKKLKDRQTTFSLKKCIQKYGEKEGKKVFEDRQKKWQLSFRKSLETNGDGRSPQSFFAKDLISEICCKLYIDYPKREKYMTDENGNHYAYDFTLGHRIIEFNGDFWHCNPKTYKADFFNRAVKKTAQEIWDHDAAKIKCAEDNNYEVLTIWESEYNEDFESTLNKCLNFLNG